MARAKRAKEDTGNIARLAAEAQRKGDESSLSGKKWSGLSAPEKDLLLKVVGIRLGIILPD